jgi:hypothetical protein
MMAKEKPPFRKAFEGNATAEAKVEIRCGSA